MHKPCRVVVQRNCIMFRGMSSCFRAICGEKGHRNPKIHSRLPILWMYDRNYSALQNGMDQQFRLYSLQLIARIKWCIFMCQWITLHSSNIAHLLQITQCAAIPCYDFCAQFSALCESVVIFQKPNIRSGSHKFIFVLLLLEQVPSQFSITFSLFHVM